MLTRMSLRRSVPLLLLLFSLSYTLLLILFYLPHSIDSRLQEWRDHTDRLLILVQSTLDDEMRIQNTAEVSTELADLASLQGIRWAMVVDENFQTIAATRLGLRPDNLGFGSLGQLRDSIMADQPTWLQHDEQRYLAIYPLSKPGQRGATQHLALLVDLDFMPLLRQSRSDALTHLGQTLCALVLLGFLLNRLYSRLITQRLALIEAATHRFSAAQRPEMPATEGQDEIGMLARTFSTMTHQLHERQLALLESEYLMRGLIDAAPLGMLVLDEAQLIEQANPAAARLLGCTPNELQGHSLQGHLAEPDGLARLCQAPANTAMELTGNCQGRPVPLEMTCTPFQRGGQAFRLILLSDISERVQAEQRLRFLAHFDPLTQLANRHYLMQRLEQLLASGCSPSLLFLDLDHFKRINDTLGHEIGDRLLVEAAGRLARELPERSLLARFGGDEFAILLEDRTPDEACRLAERILASFRPPLQIRQYECRITPSIGIAGNPGCGNTATELLKQADLALYAAKDAGRNRLSVYNSTLGEAADRRRQLEQELRQALERGEFVLHYQPQVDAHGRPETMEALLRWQSPSRGLVPPGEFMPVLEDSGLIIEVTRWVFRQACRQAVAWAGAGHRLRIAVNLSPLDFRQADLAGHLLAILAQEGAPAERLELEITETALLNADKDVMDTLGRLKTAGLPLLLDDFGTGYASLTYLQRFPFDGIKIDRQFVAGLPDSPHSVALVRGILTMAEQLGLHVVAEGVENACQAGFLLQNGCPSQQGYYYAKPQPAERCLLAPTQPEPSS